MSLDYLRSSDKLFWHRYLPFYEPYFNELGGAQYVLEYGVARGASVKYLSERFQRASIIGCDILAPLPEWPRSERISYETLDQGNPQTLEQLFHDHPGPFDLVIEDGSHEPTHQRNCLVATLPHVRPGGVYIVEDLHTSHPDYGSMAGRDRGVTNCYHLLLAFEHVIASGKTFGEPAAQMLSGNSLFTKDEVEELFRSIAGVEFYRRSALPLCCYRCGSNEFAYDKLRCRCGTELMERVDSISAIVRTKQIAC